MDGSIQERINSKGKKVYDVMFRAMDSKTGIKKQRIKRGFSKKGDAQKYLNEVLGQIENNSYIDAKKITLRELLEEWYKKYVEGKLAPNTVRGYKVNIYKHIIPNIGWIPLQQLTSRDIENFYNELYKDNDDDTSTGLSATSIEYIHRNLSKALDYATKERLILRNPARDAERPSKEIFYGDVFDQRTIMQLLTTVKNDPMELPIALSGLSGLRRGEDAGLMWIDVDLDRCILNIRKQRTAGAVSTKRDKLKTLGSYRSIRITKTLSEILKRHKELQNKNKEILGEDYVDTGFVCCEPDGSIVDPSTYSKRFSQILKKHNFKAIRFHDLRHSFATNLIRLGVPINTVSKMLGHSSVTITLDIYAHVLEEMQQDAVIKMDEDISKYIDNQDDIIDIDTNNKTDER
jgi:integrase